MRGFARVAPLLEFRAATALRLSNDDGKKSALPDGESYRSEIRLL
jgi:hypothetical protein